MLINKIKELASDALAVLSQSNQELLQQRRDGITKNLSREYKTLKHNIPPDSKLLFGDDLNNRIKLLQASNKAYNINITSNNSRYYQTYSPNFSRNQENSNSKNFKGEESLQKLPSRRNHNRDRETNKSPSTGIKKSGKGHTIKFVVFTNLIALRMISFNQ